MMIEECASWRLPVATSIAPPKQAVSGWACGSTSPTVDGDRESDKRADVDPFDRAAADVRARGRRESRVCRHLASLRRRQDPTVAPDAGLCRVPGDHQSVAVPRGVLVEHPVPASGRMAAADPARPRLDRWPHLAFLQCGTG